MVTIIGFFPFGIITIISVALNQSIIAVNNEHNLFEKVINECNNTYPVIRDLIFTHDLDTMVNQLKGNKNGKCFLHCFLNKLTVVDIKGNIKKPELFENLNRIINGISDDSNDMKISEGLKRLVETYVNQCEQSEMVKNENDACDKVYKFITCFKDTE